MFCTQNNDLKQRRLERGLTQREVARLAKCSREFISLAERGKAGVSAGMEERINLALDGKTSGKSWVPTSAKMSEEDRKFFHELWVERYEG